MYYNIYLYFKCSQRQCDKALPLGVALWQHFALMGAAVNNLGAVLAAQRQY
jgi:hypothetical protein